MAIADSGTLGSPVPLDASNVAYLLSQCPQWTAYEAIVLVKHVVRHVSGELPEHVLYGFAVDFAAVVGPERKDHRIFLDAGQGAIVYLIPWRDDGPVSSLPGYSMSIEVETGFMMPPTPRVLVAERKLL